MKGLISKSPHVENILSGKKTWEIRGSNTKIRGEIALIKSGSGTIVGKCEIIDVIGPLGFSDLEANIDKHCVEKEQLKRVFGKYRKLYSWVLGDAVKFSIPIAYDHPNGAVIWVNLKEGSYKCL